MDWPYVAKLGHYHQELANCLAKRDKEDEEHEKLINEMKADIQAEYDRQTRVVKADFDRDERSMRMVFEADIQMLTALYRNKLERVVKVKDADLADIKIFIDTSLSERSESLEAIAALRRIDRATEDAIFSRLRAELDLPSSATVAQVTTMLPQAPFAPPQVTSGPALDDNSSELDNSAGKGGLMLASQASKRDLFFGSVSAPSSSTSSHLAEPVDTNPARTDKSTQRSSAKEAHDQTVYCGYVPRYATPSSPTVDAPRERRYVMGGFASERRHLHMEPIKILPVLKASSRRPRSSLYGAQGLPEVIPRLSDPADQEEIPSKLQMPKTKDHSPSLDAPSAPVRSKHHQDEPLSPGGQTTKEGPEDPCLSPSVSTSSGCLTPKSTPSI